MLSQQGKERISTKNAGKRNCGGKKVKSHCKFGFLGKSETPKILKIVS